MTYRKTMLSASIVAALMFAGAACAHDGHAAAAPDAHASPQQSTTSQQSSNQETPAQKEQQQKAQKLNTVTVVGIRNAAALSLQLQKEAVSDVNVVTAEDIGKLPAKNVAATLQAIPGVSLQAGSAGEGGFDAPERVAMRGTAPSLTLTQINGHTLASSDWFILNQTATVGRSVNYGLLPAGIVSEIVVHKTSEASLNEGGATGTVNIITRRPLQFKKDITVHASIGGVYAEMPKKADPQFSALLNFKNQAGTFGLLVQGFYQERHLQRDGQELLGYSQILPTTYSAMEHPDVANAYVPSLIDTTLFQQTRKRKGGMVNLQFKPSDNVDIDFEGFYSKMDASNLNDSLSFWGVQVAGSNTAPLGVPVALSDYTVNHNLLTKATFTSTNPSGQSLLGVYDQIGRPGASASTGYVTGDLKWNVSNNFTFHAQVGYTKGEGKSPTQNVLETNINAVSASYDMRGLGKAVNWMLGNNQFAQPTNASHTTVFGWIFGDQDIDVKNTAKWVNLDGTLDFFDGPLESLQFGGRYQKNAKGNDMDIGQGPLGGTDYATAWESLPIGSHFPSNHASKIGVSSEPMDVWILSQAQLAAFDNGRVNRAVSSPLYAFGPAADASRFNPSNVYHVNEKDLSLYVQANFGGDNWSGNVGLRWIHTKQFVQYTTSAATKSDNTQGPYSSAFFPSSAGGYYLNFHNYNYSKLLPSANIKFDLTDDLISRTGISQTITRANYSALSGALSLSDPILTGTGGNPLLKPLISTNFDTGLAWYFAPRGLLSMDVYMQHLHDYVDFKAFPQTFKNQTATGTGADVFSTYQVTIPSNINGHIYGVELDWRQPIGKYFGTFASYTFNSGGADGGRPMKGMSKKTFDVGGYFENSRWHARLTYVYRSAFYEGVDRGLDYYMEGTGYLSAQVGYKATKWLSINLVGRNLNNPTLKYFVDGPNFGKAPRAYFVNGRQYFLTADLNF